MIKQIQLRGISHSPSDRLTADGGLDDCIDLRLEGQEHGPEPAALPVSETLAPGLTSSGIVVSYIHKTDSYTNYVGSVGDKLAAWRKQAGGTWDGVYIHTYPSGVGLASITSIGNMLIYSLTDGTSGYALYKNYTYLDLGSSIPRPTVSFTCTPQTGVSERRLIDATDISNLYYNQYGGLPTGKQLWEYVRENRLKETPLGEYAADLFGSVNGFIWEIVNSWRRDKRDSGIFSAPVLARYAVKLYDGTDIFMSEPILLSAGKESYMDAPLANLGINGSTKSFFVEAGMQGLYKPSVSITYTGVSNWSDIIKSVDIYLSTDILDPPLNAEMLYDQDAYSRMSESGYTFDADDISFHNTSDNASSFEAAMLKCSNFYKVASFDIGELPGTPQALNAYSQDELVVQDRLEEKTESHFINAIGSVGAYNNRLVSGEQMVTLSPGHSEPQALVPASGTTEYISVVYRVRDANGQIHAVNGYSNIAIPRGSALAYIAYPDPACVSATVYVNVGTTYTKHTLALKEHPRLNCAYGYWGLNLTFTETPRALDGWLSTNWDGLIPTGNPTYAIKNRLALSEMDNPFVFPLGQRERFSSRIIAAMPATIALSTDQRDPLPIYVFTEEGIWAVSINDEGGFAFTHAVSRDVAIDGTIEQLDNAIVFVSSQGVMILQDKQVVCISPNMKGPQFKLSSIVPASSWATIQSALTTSGYGDLLVSHLDTDDFQAFVSGCRPCYDYTNNRILFFNSSKPFAYTYWISMQVWSKLMLPTASFVNKLNGYPSALTLMYNITNSYTIYNWSVLPDYTSAVSRKGIIVTRPFDLGEPDVRKAIRSIRIRGRYDHDNVRYLLFGSFDGIRWKYLTSLRGGSYKLFRIMILADLEPEERISWIDVDFDARFADKLR